MKKVIKFLSVMLAIILVAGLISPAAKVEAASVPKINKTSKTLFVGGSKVAASSYKGTYSLKVSNKPSKYSISWTSSDSSIAKVTKKSKGRATVTAVAVGKATITCTIKDKVTGKAYTLKSKITVKKNATSVAIGKKNFPESIVVGNKMQLSSAMYDENGKTGNRGVYVTDYRMWVSDNKNVATVTKSGLVTAVGAGTATITCYTYQSGSLKAIKHATATDKVTVNVKAAGLTAVQQTAINKFTATFETDMKDKVTKDNLYVNMITTYGSTSSQSVKSVVFDTTGKIATVTMNVSFIDGFTYKIKSNDVEKEFIASVGTVAGLTIYTAEGRNTAVTGKDQQLYFKFFDSRGIDITPIDEVSYKRLTDNIILTDEGECGTSSANKTVFFYSSGKTGRVKAEYHTGDYTPGYEITYKAEVTITSVSEASTIKMEDWLITSDTVLGADIDWSKKSQKLAAQDEGFRIIVKAVGSDGKNIYSDDNASKFSFKCDKNDIIIIDSASRVIYPIKTGTADIEVSYDSIVLGVIKLSVSDKRTAKTIQLDKRNEYVSDTTGFDLCTFVVTVLDQYGEKIKMKNAEDIAVDCLSGSYPYISKALNSDGSVSVSFNGSGFGSIEGISYQYSIKYGTASNTFVAIIKSPVGTPSLRLELPAEFDMKLLSGSTYASWPAVPISLYMYCNGVKSSKVSGIKTVKDTSITTGDYFYRVMYGGSEITTGTTDFFRPYSVKGNIITKAKTGVYEVKIYQKTATSANLIDSKTFILKDTSSPVTNTKVAEKLSIPVSSLVSDAAKIQALLSCYIFKIGSVVIDSSNIAINAKVIGTTAMWVQSIDVSERIVIEGIEYVLKQTVNLGISLTN